MPHVLHFVGGKQSTEEAVKQAVVLAMKDHETPTIEERILAIEDRLGIARHHEAPDGSLFVKDATGNFVEAERDSETNQIVAKKKIARTKPAE
jgi:hypothetical protein